MKIKLNQRTKNILLLTILNLVVSALVYLLLQVVFSQILSDTLIHATDTYNILSTIVFLGFLLALIISTLSQYFITLATRSETNLTPKRIFVNSVYAMLFNLVIWVCVAFLFVFQNYRSILPVVPENNLIVELFSQGMIYIFSIPQILTVYSVYKIGSVVNWWFYTLITYTVLNGSLLYLSK